MTTKQKALSDIVALSRAHGISLRDIKRAMDKDEMGQASVLSRLFGMLGGIFIFAGIVYLIGMLWKDLSSAERVVATFGTGVLLFIAAVYTARRDVYARMVTPLFLMAFLFLPAGILTLMREYGGAGDARVALLITAGIMTVQSALVFHALRRTVLAFAIIAFGTLTFTSACNILGIPADLYVCVLGMSFIALSRAADTSAHDALAPAGYIFGALFLMAGFCDLVWKTPVEISFLGLSVFLVYLSTVCRSRSLLFAATAGILAYTGTFMHRHFSDVVAFPVMLIVLGGILAGLSVIAMRIDRKYISHNAAGS